ncbi:transcriptional regulator [Nitratireductor sp. GCM10026969]|uniref:transcriptional regulator n=1 Tax=Nitratireductor sp. GCM10026969 TaxID=3252645 RepID=UPI00360C91A0
MALFPEADRQYLSGPHVARLWFAELDLPSGLRRLHNGVGRITVGGHEWTGITNPGGLHLVQLEEVEEPRFGQAPSVGLTLGGITKDAWKEIKTMAREIEGARCDLFWAAFNPEYAEVEISLKKMFPGKLSSPALHRQGIGVRFATFTVESLWQSQNYPFGGRWNASDQERRYPGDKGGQFIGVKVVEIFNG